MRNNKYENKMFASILLCEKTTGGIKNIYNLFNELKKENGKLPGFEVVIFLDCIEVISNSTDSQVSVFVVLKKFKNSMIYGDIVSRFAMTLSRGEGSLTERLPTVFRWTDGNLDKGKYAFSAFRVDGGEDIENKSLDFVLENGELIGESYFEVLD